MVFKQIQHISISVLFCLKVLEGVYIFIKQVHRSKSDHPVLPPQVEVVQQQVTEHTESLQSSKTEIKDLNRTLQGLQIELQSLHTMVSTWRIRTLKKF